MIKFPLAELPSLESCYDFLCEIIHPNGIHCPGGHNIDNATVHRRKRYPLLDFRCKKCGKIFNIFTGTDLQGTKFNLQQILICFDCVLGDLSAQQTARNLDIDINSARRNYKKIESLVEKYKSLEGNDFTIDWLSNLKEVQGWEIKTNIDSSANDRLVLHIKNRGYYSLEIKEYTSINPRTNRVRNKKYTHVKRVRNRQEEDRLSMHIPIYNT